jgi:predicted DNA-binding transcriptional regulator AlpA
MTPTATDNLIPAPQVCQRYGRNERTLDRWLKDQGLDFPRPTYIKNRRYFREAELIAWERSQASKVRAA